MSAAVRVRLRRVRPSDAAAIAELLSACFQEYREFAPPGWDPPDQGEAASRIEAALARPATAGRVATQGGGHVGHVLWTPAADTKWVETPDPSTACLRQLFVAPAHRGGELGTRLLCDAISEAEERGYHELRLRTPSGHARARRFYEREGWSELGDWGRDPELGLRLVEYGVRLRAASGHNEAR